MVLVDIGAFPKNGAKGKAFRQTRKQASVKKARATIISGQRGLVRTSGFYGRFSGKAGSEKKFFDTTLATTALATAGVILNPSLNLVPQGVTESTRVGRKCTITRINFRAFLILSSGTAQSSELYRIMLVMDKQANGAPATIVDILETADEKSFNNLANSQRFMVLKDWYGAMNKLTDVGTNINSVQKVLTFYKSVNIPVEFSSTTGAIGEIRSNNLLLLGISSTGTTISISHTTRIRFTDS